MIARFGRSLCLALAATVVLGTPVARPVMAQQNAVAGELKTIAVVAVTRYDKLIEDINFIGSLVGKPEMGQMIEGGLALMTQGKGAKMLDRKQPWGLLLQTDGNTLLAVGCLPVANTNDLLDIARGYGAKVTDGKDGVKELVLPNEQTYFVRGQNGWSFISNSAESLASVPANPGEILGAVIKEYNVAAQVSVQDVPEAWRQIAIAWMQMGMQQGMQQGAEESDEQYEIRRELVEAQMQQAERMIHEIDSITLGWAIDPAQQRTFGDFTYLFVPGSKTAEQIKAYGEPRTNFAGFYQPDAGATMTFVTKADPEAIKQDIAQLEAMMRTMRGQVEKAIEESDDLADEREAREALKSAANDVIDAFEATIKAGQIDGGASLQASSDSLTLIAGAVVKDPKKVESALKKLDEAARKRENPETTGVKWNAESHAGVTFHTLTVPVPQEQEGPRRVFGDELNVAVGIGREAVYVALGRDNVKAIKQAIDASAAEPQKAVPPFELAVALGPIMEFAAAQADDAEQREIVESMATMLRNEAAGRDHVRVVGAILPNGLRYRIEAEEGVLRAIGKAAEEQERRRMQANQ